MQVTTPRPSVGASFCAPNVSCRQKEQVFLKTRVTTPVGMTPQDILYPDFFVISVSGDLLCSIVILIFAYNNLLG